MLFRAWLLPNQRTVLCREYFPALSQGHRKSRGDDFLERAFNGGTSTGNTSLPQSLQPEPFRHASLQHQPPVLQPRSLWLWLGGRRRPVISSLTRRLGMIMMMIKECRKQITRSIIVPHPPERCPASSQQQSLPPADSVPSRLLVNPEPLSGRARS